MRLDKFHWKFKEEKGMGAVLENYRRLSTNQENMKRAINTYKTVKKHNKKIIKKATSQPKKKLYLQMMENSRYE